MQSGTGMRALNPHLLRCNSDNAAPDPLQTTALFGKWHVGCHTNGSLPNARGFDEYEGFLTGGLTHFSHSTAVYSYPPSHAFPRGCDKCVAGYDWHRQEGGALELALDRNMTYSSEAVRDASVAFVRRQRGSASHGRGWHYVIILI